MADVNITLVLLGDGGVGKSCITMRFCEDEFTKEYNATIEHKRAVETSKLEKLAEEWDVEGFEVSAKTSEHVQEAIIRLVEIAETYENAEATSDESSSSDDNVQEQKSCACVLL